MYRTALLPLTLALLSTLGACESGTPATTAASSTPKQTSVIPTIPDPATREPAAPVAASSETDYTGIYAVQDTTICPLSITVTRQGKGYSFSCVNGQTIRGTVEVSREASGTYFTFIGLKGEEPEEDISAVWQDSVLVIQNSGNSMNEYTRFGNCDAKYLELYRQ